jgi:hypothetical protein
MKRVDHHEGGIAQVRSLVWRTEACGSAAQQPCQRLSKFNRPEGSVLPEELIEHALSRGALFQHFQANRAGRFLLVSSILEAIE